MESKEEQAARGGWWRRRLLLTAAGVSLGVSLYMQCAQRGLVPAYTRGVWQGVLSWLIALADVMRVPGLGIADVLVPWLNRHVRVPHLYWITVNTANTVFYLVAAYGLLRLAGYCYPPRRRGAGARVRAQAGVQEAAVAGGERLVPRLAETSPTRRHFIGMASAAACGAVAGVGTYSLFIEPRAYSVVRREIAIEDLPESLDGLTIAHLSDLHHCSWLPLSYIRDVVRTTNALRPDLVLLTGDYVRGSPAFIRPVMAALSELRPTIGAFATLGNHDWWQNGPLTRRCLEQAGIPTLDNARLVVTPGRTVAGSGEEGLAVAGVGDLWADRQLYEAALAGLPAGMPRLLMSHNPDVAEEQGFLSCGHRVDLMLSGHTHGGQVWLPVVGAPMTPSKYGTKYARGLVQGPSTRVFVSAGLGMSGLPLRLGAPPELPLLTLKKLKH